MRRFYLASVNRIQLIVYSLALFFSLLLASEGKAQNKISHSSSGTYTFIVPAGVTSITVEAWGGGGNGGTVGTTMYQVVVVAVVLMQENWYLLHQV